MTMLESAQILLFITFAAIILVAMFAALTL